jgi:hypothetical protein
MSRFLSHLVQRTLGQAPTVMPRLAGRYETAPPVQPAAQGDLDLAVGRPATARTTSGPARHDMGATPPFASAMAEPPRHADENQDAAAPPDAALPARPAPAHRPDQALTHEHMPRADERQVPLADMAQRTPPSRRHAEQDAGSAAWLTSASAKSPPWPSIPSATDPARGVAAVMRLLTHERHAPLASEAWAAAGPMTEQASATHLADAQAPRQTPLPGRDLNQVETRAVDAGGRPHTDRVKPDALQPAASTQAPHAMLAASQPSQGATPQRIPSPRGLLQDLPRAQAALPPMPLTDVAPGQQAAAAPTVHVTIGRIELRATAPGPTQGVARPPAPRPTVSLRDYLERRNAPGRS